MKSRPGFETWLRYVFDDPGPADREDHPFPEPEHDVVVAECLARIFRDPEIVLERYGPKALERGMWWLASIGEGDAYCIFWNVRHVGPNPLLPWEARRDVILAMGDLFERLFSTHPCGSACFMWWDLLLGYIQADGEAHSPAPAVERPRVRETAFGVLSRILDLDAPHCQRSALHGLSHLRYPDHKEPPMTQWPVTDVIRRFLARNDLDDETRAYAERCLEGPVS